MLLFLRIMNLKRQAILLVITGTFWLVACHTPQKTTTTVKPDSPISGANRFEEKIGAGISSPGLVAFMEEWYGAPYKFAGKSKTGVDCSGFASVLLKEVFQKNMTGSSVSLYEQSIKIDKAILQEGDLVFFRTGGSQTINHIGIYLSNGFFIHASVNSGVVINSLSESYYASAYCCAGRWWW